MWRKEGRERELDGERVSELTVEAVNIRFGDKGTQTNIDKISRTGAKPELPIKVRDELTISVLAPIRMLYL